LREEHVARFATSTLKDDAGPMACAALRALSLDLLLLSRP